MPIWLWKEKIRKMVYLLVVFLIKSLVVSVVVVIDVSILISILMAIPPLHILTLIPVVVPIASLVALEYSAIVVNSS